MGRHSSALPPSPKVLCAFGATDTPIQLDGGQGQNYQSGQIILKPGKDDEETNWIADFYQSVRSETFRLPQPIHTDSGALVVDGWQGWEYLEGEHKPGRWTEIIEVCINFHSAIAAIPKPA